MSLLLLRLLVKPLFWLQGLIAFLELGIAPLKAKIFRLRGISYYALRREEGQFVNPEAFFKEVEALLKEAKEVKIALGEMGHALIDNPRFITAFRERYALSPISVEIVHGPRVDPETSRIFELARDQMVDLYRMPSYQGHHFYLFTLGPDEVAAIDEGTHNETFWVKNSSGTYDGQYQSLLRNYYIGRSKHRAARLRNEFEKRKGIAHRIYRHPGIHPPQAFSCPRFAFDVLANMPNKHVLQPAAIFTGLPLDILYENVLRSSRRGLDQNGYTQTIGEEAQRVDMRPGEPPRSIKDVTLDITLRGISDAPECVACGYKTEKALVEYVCGDRLIVRAEKAPGYRCPRDGLTYLSSETLLEFLPIALKYLESAGDKSMAKTVAAALEHEREVAVQR